MWLLLVPQLVVASATIDGLAASAGTALILFLPGGTLLWMIVSTVSATAVVLWGRYAGVERICTVIAVVLGVAAIVAAAVTFSDGAGFVAGLAPAVPADVDYAELLPWLGFASAGAAGSFGTCTGSRPRATGSRARPASSASRTSGSTPRTSAGCAAGSRR